MKNLIKNSIDISIKNWPTFLLFDIGFKAFSYSLLYSITTELVSSILKFAGITYLSAENLHVILLNPISLLLSILLIFIIVLTVYFEVTALFVYSEAGWDNEKVTIFELLKRTAYQSIKIFNLKIIGVFILFTLASMVATLPFSPYVIHWLKMPEFITDFLTQNSLLFPIYIILLIGANIFSLLFLFILPGILFKNENPSSAWRNGLKLFEKRKIKTILQFIGSFILAGLIIIAILGFGIIILVAFIKIFENNIESRDVFSLYYMRFFSLGSIIAKSILTVWLFSILLSLFHSLSGEGRPIKESFKSRKFQRIKSVATIIFAVLSLAIFSETELGGSIVYRNYSKIEVVAHRGGTLSTPENTITAVENAIKLGADMVEIDIQQLKDGTLILMHDDNFSRTTGINVNVWDVNYDEVKLYDAGGWFSDEFKGTPIPTLGETLKSAKGQIDVMIELKLSGHENNLVEDVLNEIEKNSMENQISIGSLNLDILKEVKRLNPKIKTVYITPLIYSGKYDIDFLDGFSVETTSLTREMVVLVKMQGKKIYAWTANSKETIEKNIDLNVSGIVTDNIELVKFYISNDWQSMILDYTLELFFKEPS